MKSPHRFAWILVAALAALSAAASAVAQPSFVAFESGHVRPLALSPDGGQLFAVNTPDNTLEIFDVSGGGLVAVETNSGVFVSETDTGTDPFNADSDGDAGSMISPKSPTPIATRTSTRASRRCPPHRRSGGQS